MDDKLEKEEINSDNADIKEDKLNLNVADTNEDEFISESKEETISENDVVLDSDNKNSTVEDVDREDNLELHNMKFMERMRAKKERYKKNTEGMSAGQKLGYFVYYYKGRVFLTITLIFLAIAVPVTIYNKTRPVAISYAIINCSNPKDVNDSLFEDYRNSYTFKEPNQIVEDKDVKLDPDEYDESVLHSANNTDYAQFPMLCHNNYYDIIFTDRTGMEFLSTNSVVLTLEAGLPTDLYSLIEDQYASRIYESPNYNGDPVPYAINITGTDFAKELNLGYEPIYICFPGNDERNISNAKKMVDYIFNLGLDL